MIHQISRRLVTTCMLLLLLTLAGCSEPADATKSEVGAPVAQSLLQNLTATSKAGLSQSSQTAKVALFKIDGPRVSTTDLPAVLYVGAGFCPYCAALRWPLVLSLARFGSFTDLKYMRSSSSDAYPDTATFSFQGASYQSQYVLLQAVELSDRNGKRLDTLSPAQQALFTKFDTKPYTPYTGSIPFLYIGGQYLETGSPLSPKLFKGMDWDAVNAAFKDASTPLAQELMNTTNIYTAAICRLTADQPSKVCKAPAVTAAAKLLPTAVH